jgi:hypothetical protein
MDQAAAHPATAREIIAEIVRNMREGLEPLHFSTLAPGVFDVYLHPNDFERLGGIFPRIIQEARQALDGELESLNRASLAERLKISKRSEPKITPPEGGWRIRLLENTDDGVAAGDILICSELALPEKSEFGAGSMTKRIATRRLGGAQQPSSQTFENAPPAAAQTRTEAGAHAVIEYEDQGGRKQYSMTRDEIVVGRGGRDYWTDLKLETLPDVSREHCRIRRDPASGKFFLKDLSRLGTTINGEKVPSSLEIENGQKKDLNLESPLPDLARIGLAGVLTLEFRSGSHG